MLAQYECVMNIVAIMKEGERVKRAVDKAVDACSDIDNIRNNIYLLKTKYEEVCLYVFINRFIII